jgi:uncharacterized GH25 family protein
MKRAALISGIIIFSGIAFAHEFWLHPQKYFYTIRETANIRFSVGENFEGENWKGNKDEIAQLLYFTPSGNVLDIASRISGNSGDSLQLPLQEEGTHLVIFNSTNSFIKLEADKFNEYLKDDGHNETALYRKEHGEGKKAGTEYYQRSVKTLLQVSGKLTNACTEITSLPLDIIPAENPYSIPDPASNKKAIMVRYRVLFQGEPLPNALVKAWYHLPGKGPGMDSVRTNKKGWVSLERHPGPYMVSCVHMERAKKGGEADWQSYWGSLSFEYSQFYNRRGSR